MDTSDPDQLPCGCYGRCGCRRRGFSGFVIAASLAAPLALGLGSAANASLGPDVLPGVALGLLAFEFCHCAFLTLIAALAEGRQAARSLWGFAKVYSGMALGTVVGIGIAAVLVLSLSRAP